MPHRSSQIRASHKEAIDTLKLFIERVERLQSRSIVRALTDQGSHLEISWKKADRALEISHSGPGDEQEEAAALNFRLFIQDNDQISIRKTGILLETMPVSAELKQHFAKNQTHLNNSLDTRSMVNINGDNPTRREIFEVVLYGELAHLTSDKRQRYLSWMQFPLLRGIIDSEFNGVMI